MPKPTLDTPLRIPQHPSPKSNQAVNIPPEQLVRIYSGEHGAYWRKDGHGYSVGRDEAWVATYAEAQQKVGGCDPSKGIYFEYAGATINRPNAGRYYISEYEDDETWFNGPYDTLEAAISEGRAAYEGRPFAVGEIEYYEPIVDPHSVFEYDIEQANDFAGEASDQYLEIAGNRGNPKISELQARLEEVYFRWLSEHDLLPEFGTIRNARLYDGEGNLTRGVR